MPECRARRMDTGRGTAADSRRLADTAGAEVAFPSYLHCIAELDAKAGH
ncbi:Uncharacterised protein [Mycobacteroides abscessus subsp. abscessus]|nr:Uncharacterised protein [Mycobacteroides abscessus subsp. abscessus]